MEFRLVFRYISYSILLIFLQVILFNNVLLGVGLAPFVYVMLLLFLPIDIKGWVLLIIAFFLGLFVDVFSDTLAINTSACLFVAFARPYTLRFLSPDDGYESDFLPSYHHLGLRWFALYSLVLVFIHQLVYFSLDIFELSKIGIVLIKAIINTLLTVFFILTLNIFVFKNR
jgi:hypothetical protein